MRAADIINQLGLLKRAQGKRRRIDDITYYRDGTVASVSMRCGLCEGHFIYNEGRFIDDNCPVCTKFKIGIDNKKWKIATRYLYNDEA